MAMMKNKLKLKTKFKQFREKIKILKTRPR